MKAYMQNIDDPTKFLNAGDFDNFNLIPLRSGFRWIEGEPPSDSEPYVQLDPLEAIEEIITQGQNAMAEAPLPKEIQKQIYDLEPFIQNYYRRGATQLILDAINGFSIPEDYPNVTDGQRAQVDALKAQMLAVFNA